MGNFPNRFSLSWQLYDKDRSNESGTYLTTGFKNTFKTMVQYLEGSMVTFQTHVNVMKNIMVALIALLLVTNLVCAIYLCVLSKRQTRLEGQSNSTRVQQSTNFALRDFGKQVVPARSNYPGPPLDLPPTSVVTHGYQPRVLTSGPGHAQRGSFMSDEACGDE